MANDILRRADAPITPEAWELIDEEAKRVLRGNLSARGLVDLDGPHDWRTDSVNLGLLDLKPAKGQKGVAWGLRRVQPLLEVRVPFELKQMELDSVSRGSQAPDLDPLGAAAREAAIFEESAIYNGLKAAGIDGLIPASSHKKITLGKTVEAFDSSVASGVEALQLAGVNGPYTLVLGTKPYHFLMRGILKGGYTLMRAVKDKIRGDVVWSPALESGVLLSTRGGDFELTVGQDLSVGYWRHDRGVVELYVTESFTFRVLEPRAVIAFAAGK